MRAVVEVITYMGGGFYKGMGEGKGIRSRTNIYMC